MTENSEFRPPPALPPNQSDPGQPDPAQAGTPLIGPSFPWLAPLAGHTDLVFRTLCREQGATTACTEMVSAKGLVYGEEGQRGSPASGPGSGPSSGQTRAGISATRELLRSSAADRPLVVQLFGNDPHFLGRAVELLRAWGFGWFDLNLGCSVPKVVKTGAGAALARSIPDTLACARAMIAAAGPIKDFRPPADKSNSAPKQPVCSGGQPPAGRVGFKLRLGWTREEENYLELARELEQCGAGWITLHPRHARQGFGGSANYANLALLARQLEIPLLASGDLFEAATARQRLDESGASGLMFGRGALHNPAIFRDYANLCASGDTAKNGESAGRAASRPEFLRELVLRHAELAREFAAAAPQPRRRQQPGRPAEGLLKLRGAVPRYIKDLPGSRAFRVNLSNCSNWDDFYRLLENYFAGLAN